MSSPKRPAFAASVTRTAGSASLQAVMDPLVAVENRHGQQQRASFQVAKNMAAASGVGGSTTGRDRRA